MRTIAVSALALVIGSAAVGIGSAAVQADPGRPIGSAVTVVNYVTAELENAGDTHQLFSGDDVRQQELIAVDNDGRSEIELNDRTKLVLGPGSRMLLDRFVYDPDISGGAIVLNLVKGAFRFVTGIAAKPAYVVRTPNASITVRGTIFDVYVTGPRETWLLLIEGAVEACTKKGRCLVNDEPGKLIRIADDDIDGPQRWPSITRGHDIDFDSAFPFIVKPPLIDPEVIFTRAEIVGRELPPRRYERPKREERPREAKPQKVYDATPPPKIETHRVVEVSKPRVWRKWYRVHRKHVRWPHYRPPHYRPPHWRPHYRPHYDRPHHRPYGHRPYGHGTAKKVIKAGRGVGHGIAKALKRRHRY